MKKQTEPREQSYRQKVELQLSELEERRDRLSERLTTCAPEERPKVWDEYRHASTAVALKKEVRTNLQSSRNSHGEAMPNVGVK